MKQFNNIFKDTEDAMQRVIKVVRVLKQDFQEVTEVFSTVMDSLHFKIGNMEGPETAMEILEALEETGLIDIYMEYDHPARMKYYDNVDEISRIFSAVEDEVNKASDALEDALNNVTLQLANCRVYVGETYVGINFTYHNL